MFVCILSFYLHMSFAKLLSQHLKRVNNDKQLVFCHFIHLKWAITWYALSLRRFLVAPFWFPSFFFYYFSFVSITLDCIAMFPGIFVALIKFTVTNVLFSHVFFHVHPPRIESSIGNLVWTTIIMGDKINQHNFDMCKYK